MEVGQGGECRTLGLRVSRDTAGTPADAVVMNLVMAAAIAAAGARERGCGTGARADLEAARRDSTTARRAFSAAKRRMAAALAV
jgi:triphosphoribosyl-dephospho-CoA synthetase